MELFCIAVGVLMEKILQVDDMLIFPIIFHGGHYTRIDLRGNIRTVFAGIKVSLLCLAYFIESIKNLSDQAKSYQEVGLK